MTADSASRRLDRRDLLVGTIIAVVMASGFTALSSGASLLVTFVPGVAVAWLLLFWIFWTGTELPAAGDFTPAFFATLAIQLLHFAEEYLTGFNRLFPALYGGGPYSLELFVLFNMAAYAVFTIACVLTFYAGLRFLLFPVLFFVVYGVLGNAVSHNWWSATSMAYFPGLFTAQAYWIAAPWLLFKLVRSGRVVAAVTSGMAVLLIPLLTIFAVR